MEERILRKYDCVIVVRKGSIVETGTFEELMEQKQYFYNLFNCE
jgi:ABC-type multidrug transport system fused ATPase/permease subunit